MVLDDSGPRLSSRASTMSNPTTASAAAGTSNPPAAVATAATATATATAAAAATAADDSGELEPTFDTLCLHCLPLLLFRPRRALPHVKSLSGHVQSHPCHVRSSPVLLDSSVLIRLTI